MYSETNTPIENQYPKLVRDKIPEIIKKDGMVVRSHVATPEEYIQHLFSKLLEESSELKNARGRDHQMEELADVREVLASLQIAIGL